MVAPSSYDAGKDELRVLAVTRIFPNRVEPLACAFARQQLGALARRANVEVLATIPWFPGAWLLGDRTRPGRLTRVPFRDVIDGVIVRHPRAPYLPGAGSLLAPVNAPLYFAGLLPFVPSLRGRFDVVLGAFLYPDACAAAALSRLLGLPYAVKTHGTDVNVVASWPSVRPLVASTLRGASAVMAVSRPIRDRLVELGAAPERTELVANGVDRELFRPADRALARSELGLPDGPLVLFVGALEKQKGVLELVEAIEQVRARGPSGRSGGARPVHLVLVGQGSGRLDLEARARASNAAVGQTIVAGPRPLADVARYLAACDVLTLPSWAEGTPNVVLEALASGRPVVASNVGGIPDVVDARNGILVPARDAPSLARALREALGRTWDASRIAATAPVSWEASAERLREVLLAAVSRPAASGGVS